MLCHAAIVNQHKQKSSTVTGSVKIGRLLVLPLQSTIWPFLHKYHVMVINKQSLIYHYYHLSHALQSLFYQQGKWSPLVFARQHFRVLVYYLSNGEYHASCCCFLVGALIVTFMTHIYVVVQTLSLGNSLYHSILNYDTLLNV